jgi:taurine--2-oxoglutarate transaminase
MSDRIQDIRRLTADYTLYEWGTQGDVSPIVIDQARGVYFWDEDGKCYLDFNSQVMCVNIGHGDPRMIEAVRRQMEHVCYVQPRGATTWARAEAGRLLIEVTPDNLTRAFFTTAGADAIENAVKLARLVTRRHKIITRYRSYHGATFGAATLTGDPRRWPIEPGISGVIHVHDAYPYRCRWCRHHEACTLDCLHHIEDTITFEGAHTIAAILIEPVVGTNGLLIPPAGYLEGLRDLCNKHDILLIADEVMSGFGRTGKWFAVDHWGVQPDMMTVAKGLTSGYIPLGAVVVSDRIADYFQEHPLPTGLTYNSHPVACAAAAACITIMKEDRLVENAARMGEILQRELSRLQERHPCVGEVRALGLFSLVELVKNRQTREPLVPFNATPAQMEPMHKLQAFLLEHGLSTYLRWHTFFINPPLCITEGQLREGLEIIDHGLALLDAEVAENQQ